MKNTYKIPTAEQLEKALKEFENIDWNSIDINSVEDAIPWALRAMPIISLTREFKHYLYRVRPFHSFKSATENDNIFRPQSFSYPPIGTLSRAGTIKYPVFYCASNLELALIESKSNDSLNFLGCWRLNENVNLNVRPYLSNLSKEIQDSDETFILNYKQALNAIMGNFAPEQRDVLNKLENFHDSQFIKEGTDNYKYSSWVAYRNLEYAKSMGFTTPDAIMYQSVMLNQLGTNLAIDPDFVDNKMILEKIYLINHKFNSKENTFERLILSVGKKEGNSILWNAPTSDDIKEFREKHEIDFHVVNFLKS